MFLADCHTHSACSPDSSTPMVEMAKRAVEYGLTALTLTDHCDLLGLEGERTPDYDWAPVLEQRKETLAAFGTRLDLPMGVELGMAFLFPEAADQILSQPGIDSYAVASPSSARPTPNTRAASAKNASRLSGSAKASFAVMTSALRTRRRQQCRQARVCRARG